MTEAVLFDFGGTLDDDGRPWSRRFYLGYVAAGGRISERSFETCFHASEELLEARACADQLGFEAMVQAQVLLLQRLLPDGEQLDGGRWAEGFVAEAVRTADRNFGLLTGLRRRFDLAVVSNFMGNLRPCLAELGLERCFDVVLDSGTIGIRKPDRRLFAAAMDGLGVRAEQCLMVGDNPFADIAPAALLGCDTCWLAPPERDVPAGVPATRRIAALPELLALLS